MIAERVIEARGRLAGDQQRGPAGRSRDARQRGKLPPQEGLHRPGSRPGRKPDPHMTLLHRPRSGDGGYLGSYTGVLLASRGGTRVTTGSSRSSATWWGRLFIAGAYYLLSGRDEYLPAATSSGARFDGDISATDRCPWSQPTRPRPRRSATERPQRGRPS